MIRRTVDPRERQGLVGVGPFPPYQGPTEVYDLTGVLEDRSAWVESWIIEAGTFFLEEPSGAWRRYGDVQRYRKERPSGSA